MIPMLTVGTFSLVMIGGIAIMNLRLRRAREQMMVHTRRRFGSQPSLRGSSAGDGSYVSDTGAWSLSNWFGDSGSSGYDGCVSSDSGGGDCSGGDGGGGGH